MEEGSDFNFPFAIKTSKLSGFVKDVQAAEEILRAYETRTTTKFNCFKQKKGFANTGKLQIGFSNALSTFYSSFYLRNYRKCSYPLTYLIFFVL